MSDSTRLSASAAVLMRKLLVKPVLMSEQEILENKKVLEELTTIDPVYEESLAEIIGDPSTGRFVILCDDMGTEDVEWRMILDMVKDSTGIKRLDLLLWASDLDLDIEDFRETLAGLVDLGVLEIIGDNAPDDGEEDFSEDEEEIEEDDSINMDDTAVVRFR